MAHNLILGLNTGHQRKNMYEFYNWGSVIKQESFAELKT
jgi:hypothetical protein